ncbi:ammonium transporter [Azotosporobacter soli]|uniref:ammonium transporter n=1 Tax=Azotosporobacter soli TaxID=3055040 RepID=UPI0031FEE975
MKKLTVLTLLFLVLFSFASVAGAEEVVSDAADAAAPVVAAKIDSGDTAFVLFSAALVMLMTPALALFYGGMVRTKNVLSTLMQSFFSLGLISVQWVLIGYSLSFGPDVNHLIGNLSWFGLAGVGQDANPDYAATIPHLAFMIFQAMFAVITPALISGSLAERMRFPAFAVFVLLWSTLVYDPVAHWVWGTGGWLRDMGILDFAGGTVVHILSGVSGLVVALYLGKRKGYGSEVMLPHHLPMTVLGASLLWFGWFGFNAGSALGANGLAANAFIVTHIAAAAATVSWVVSEWLQHGKPTILGAASGCVAGLVAITPAAGYVSPLSAIALGALGGIICYAFVSIIKQRFGYDDSLDAFGVHGIGGTWGAIATGIFASKDINAAGADGLLFGNPDQLLTQLIGVGVSWAFAAVATLVILKAISLVMQLRVDPSDEAEGLDIVEHGERGYAYQDLSIGSQIALPFSSLESSPAVATADLKLGYK